MVRRSTRWRRHARDSRARSPPTSSSASGAAIASTLCACRARQCAADPSLPGEDDRLAVLHRPLEGLVVDERELLLLVAIAVAGDDEGHLVFFDDLVVSRLLVLGRGHRDGVAL